MSATLPTVVLVKVFSTPCVAVVVSVAFSNTDPVSSFASGRSFTGVTVMSSVEVSVLLPSVTV